MTDNDQTQTAGTPGQDGGDGAGLSPTAGTPASDDRDAQSGEVEQLKALLAAQKDKIEEANRVLREKESAERAPSPAAPSGGYQPTEEERRLIAWEDSDDPAAIKLRRMEREIVLKAQLDELPKEQRKDTLAHYLKNQHRLGDITAARAELDAPTLRSEVERLRQENEALKRKPPDDVLNAPPTPGRETTARGNTIKPIPEAQFDENLAHIRATQGELAAMKYQAENASRVR